jgi:hypothetical protein
MGYTTDFTGEFQLDKPLRPEHKAYLSRFNASRRMKRNSSIAEKFPDPLRISAGLPIGIDGEFYVGTDEGDKEAFSPTDPRHIKGNDSFNQALGFAHGGQRHDSSIISYNDSPSTQPGLWCQWIHNEAGTAIIWDEGEKFYNYIEWLKYIIDNFISPWGYKLNGEVGWQGEEAEDRGRIVVEDNKVRIQRAKFVYEDVHE